MCDFFQVAGLVKSRKLWLPPTVKLVRHLTHRSPSSDDDVPMDQIVTHPPSPIVELPPSPLVPSAPPLFATPMATPSSAQPSALGGIRPMVEPETPYLSAVDSTPAIQRPSLKRKAKERSRPFTMYFSSGSSDENEPPTKTKKVKKPQK